MGWIANELPIHTLVKLCHKHEYKERKFLACENLMTFLGYQIVKTCTNLLGYFYAFWSWCLYKKNCSLNNSTITMQAFKKSNSSDITRDDDR